MISADTLQALQLILLVCDGIGIVASWVIAEFYRKASGDKHIFWLWLFFMCTAVIFLTLTVSDIIVIAKLNVPWAALPIVRGLGFRVPFVIMELLLAAHIYGGWKRNNGH